MSASLSFQHSYSEHWTPSPRSNVLKIPTCLILDVSVLGTCAGPGSSRGPEPRNAVNDLRGFKIFTYFRGKVIWQRRISLHCNCRTEFHADFACSKSQPRLKVNCRYPGLPMLSLLLFHWYSLRHRCGTFKVILSTGISLRSFRSCYEVRFRFLPTFSLAVTMSSVTDFIASSSINCLKYRSEYMYMSVAMYTMFHTIILINSHSFACPVVQKARSNPMRLKANEEYMDKDRPKPLLSR